MTKKKELQFIICSGGDDQAITVAWMSFHQPQQQQVHSNSSSSISSSGSGGGSGSMLTTKCIQTTKGASSSALKGVRIRRNVELGGYRLYAVGYDQRLALWQITTFLQKETKKNDTISTQFIVSVPVDVFDTNCLDCCSINTTKIKQQLPTTDDNDNDNTHYEELLIVGGEGMELVSFDPTVPYPTLKTT